MKLEDIAELNRLIDEANEDEPEVYCSHCAEVALEDDE